MSEGQGGGTSVVVPPAVRVRLARPAVQLIADGAGVDLLHIKGDAVDRDLRAIAQPGTDVDALVRPGQIAALDSALRAHGWRVYSSFRYGSPFAHAQTYVHPMWGYFDLHRSFPGIRCEPGLAFEMMWAQRRTLVMPGARGSVPSLEIQAMLLVLNDARNRRQDPDPVRHWIEDAGVDRAAVYAWVERLDARVAFAAATGELNQYRGERDYSLWRVITQGGTRSAEWRARIRAASTASEAIRTGALAPLVNVEHLEHQLGRSPTRREIAAAFLARPARAIRELGRRHGRGDSG